jgi:hypothetical protein
MKAVKEGLMRKVEGGEEAMSITSSQDDDDRFFDGCCTSSRPPPKSSLPPATPQKEPVSPHCPPVLKKGPPASNTQRSQKSRKKKLEMELEQARQEEERKEQERREKERQEQENLAKEKVLDQDGAVLVEDMVSEDEDQEPAKSSWSKENPYGDMKQATFFRSKNKLAAMFGSYPLHEQITLTMCLAATRSLPSLKCPLTASKLRLSLATRDLAHFLSLG